MKACLFAMLSSENIYLNQSQEKKALGPKSLTLRGVGLTMNIAQRLLSIFKNFLRTAW